MPEGLYRRKPKADNEAAPEKPAKKRKPPLRAALARSPSRSDEPRFGVFEDGSVSISTERCKGDLGTEDFLELVRFAKRIGIDV